MEGFPYNKNYKGPKNDLVGESGDSDALYVPPWKHALKSKNVMLEELKIPHFDITGDSVTLDSSDICDVDTEWSNYLAGCVAGKFPGLRAMARLKSYWNVDCDIMPHSDGWVIFKFHDPTVVDKVFTGGPYHIFGRTMFLKKGPMDSISKKMIYTMSRLGLNSPRLISTARIPVLLGKLHPLSVSL